MLKRILIILGVLLPYPIALIMFNSVVADQTSRGCHNALWVIAVTMGVALCAIFIYLLRDACPSGVDGCKAYKDGAFVPEPCIWERFDMRAHLALACCAFLAVTLLTYFYIFAGPGTLLLESGPGRWEQVQLAQGETRICYRGRPSVLFPSRSSTHVQRNLSFLGFKARISLNYEAMRVGGLLTSEGKLAFASAMPEIDAVGKILLDRVEANLLVMEKELLAESQCEDLDKMTLPGVDNAFAELIEPMREKLMRDPQVAVVLGRLYQGRLVGFGITALERRGK